MAFGVLGPLEVSVGGQAVELGAPKVRTLLATLLLRPNRVVPADLLVEILWGDEPPDSAVNTLQGYVSRLRKALGGEVVQTRSPGYVLVVDRDRIDAFRFERLVAEGRAALAEGDPQRAALLLTEALALWRGEALTDFAYAGWAQPEIARLRELRLTAVEERVDAQLMEGRHQEVLGTLETLVQEHPHRERLWAGRIVALYRAGRQVDALRAYQELRRSLADELGIDPSPELASLDAAVLRHDPSLDWRPAPRVASALPMSRSSFVGRHAELAELQMLLGRGGLISVVGTGGVGKTRLALEVARRIAGGYGDGVRLVELGSLSDPTLVPEAVAAACDVQEEAGRTLTEALGATLRGRHLLVLLDNCEHLLDGVTPLVDDLLRAAPRLTILATSRRPLRVDGEQVWRLPSLAVPEGDDVSLASLLASDAARLFVDRAQAADARFTLSDANASAVAELCRRLDGIPLALELAAARIAVLSPAQLAARLDERFALLSDGTRTAPSRQQTLRAAVEWSYESLPAAERALFERLSVFSGGFTLEAAHHVGAAGGVDAAAVVVSLAALVDQSLVVAEHRGDTVRYRLLETLRQYALERLVKSGDFPAAVKRHVEWYVDKAENAPAFLGASSAHALDPAGDEVANMRQALQWALDQDDVATAVRMVNAGGFAYVQEGAAWAQKVVSAAAHAEPRVRAEALLVQGTIAIARGDLAGTVAAREQALPIFRELGDDVGMGATLHYLGAARAMQGDHEGAKALYRESVEAWRRSGAERGYGTAFNFILHNLGLIALEDGDVTQARAYLDEALRIARRLTEEAGVSAHLWALGQVDEVAGHLDRASSHYEQSLTQARAMGFVRMVVWTLTALGRLAEKRGEIEAAARLHAEALEQAWEEGDRIGATRVLVGLASVAAQAGALDRAASLLGAVEAYQDTTSFQLPTLERAAFRDARDVVEKGPDQVAYQEAWRCGRQWMSDQVLAESRSVAALFSHVPTTTDRPAGSSRNPKDS